MAETDRERWVILGRRNPPDGVSMQADYTTVISNQYRTQLIGSGLAESKLAALQTWRSKLASLTSGRQTAVAGSDTALDAVELAVSDSKAHLFIVRNAAPIVIRDNKITDSTPEHLQPAGSLGRSPRKILRHLETIRGLVEKYNEPLSAFFHGETALEAHDRVTRALADAEAHQEAKRGSLPEDTVALNEAKGALVELIEDINRVGRIAFMGQAEIAGKFNKDILLRARRNRRKGAKSDSNTAATATTSTTELPPESE